MGIEIPGALRTVASVAVGQDWPQTDETSLRRLADDWEIAASRIEKVGEAGEAAIQRALEAVVGDVNVSMSEHWERVGGPGGVVDELTATCRQLADLCEQTAADVEHAKLSIIVALATLAAEVAALVASTVATLGTSAAAVPAAEAATQVAVRMILRELLESLSRSVAAGVVREGGLSAIIQGAQFVAGDRPHMNFSNIAKDAVAGGVGAGVSHQLEGLGKAVGAEVRDAVGGLVGERIRHVAGSHAEVAAGLVGAHVAERSKAVGSPPPPPPSGDAAGAASSLNMG
ncbi:hypothetical protein [Rhodococcus sp. ACT016]|uniref:WXG100-like domain-containing protein n=1 Tax=Rhodococcus sp. ACT016 TaxID=3134808 RepID=UPI003D2E56A2